MRWRVVIALILLYVTYLLIGAAVFYSLEFAHEENLCQEILAELKKYNLTKNRAETQNVSDVDTKDFVQLILKAARNGVQFDSASTASCAHNWYYQNAFFFAGTLITTIGYGNIAPTTRGGQTFSILYALIGLPLFGVMFSEIGDKIAECFKRLDRKMKQKGHKTRCRKIIVLLATCSALMVFFLIIPSTIFMVAENWSFHEAFYYSFISLTTIGLGDFVVGSNPDLTYSSIYRIGVYFWILFGLAFMASAISLFTDLIKHSAQYKIHMEATPTADQVERDEENISSKLDNMTSSVKKDPNLRLSSSEENENFHSDNVNHTVQINLSNDRAV